MLRLPFTNDGDAGEGHRLMDPNSLQHINVKVFVSDPSAVEILDAVGVFHRWIKDGVCREMLIDVAEYRHVPAGPGVLLIGLEANYSFDERENRLGLLYNRKDSLDGTFQSRLAQAHQAALAACDRLEQEAVFNGKLKFDRASLEVFVNDRLLAPNTDETWQALKPELEAYFPGSKIERRGEPRDLFRVAVGQALSLAR
jgi:hypothetical protein